MPKNFLKYVVGTILVVAFCWIAIPMAFGFIYDSKFPPVAPYAISTKVSFNYQGQAYEYEQTARCEVKRTFHTAKTGFISWSPRTNWDNPEILLRDGKKLYFNFQPCHFDGQSGAIPEVNSQWHFVTSNTSDQIRLQSVWVKIGSETTSLGAYANIGHLATMALFDEQSTPSIAQATSLNWVLGSQGLSLSNLQIDFERVDLENAPVSGMEKHLAGQNSSPRLFGRGTWFAAQVFELKDSNLDCSELQAFGASPWHEYERKCLLGDGAPIGVKWATSPQTIMISPNEVTSDVVWLFVPAAKYEKATTGTSSQNILEWSGKICILNQCRDFEFNRSPLKGIYIPWENKMVRLTADRSRSHMYE